MGRFRDPNYDQSTFVAVSIQSQLIEGSFEWALHRIVEEELDLSVFDGRYHNDETGAPAYHPKVLLKVVLAAYAKGITSSRRIAQLCETNVVFIALAADQRPHFATIAGFVSSLATEVTALFSQVLLTANEMGLIGKQMFAVDGVKMPSNASKSWSGTREELLKKAKKMDRAVKVLLARHRQTDAQEECPDRRAARSQQIDTLRVASKKVKAWLNEHREDRRGPNGNVRKSNLTDPQSAKMKTSHGVIQGYDGVAMVDEFHQIVVHAQAFGEPQEHALLIPMLEGTRQAFRETGIGTDVLKTVTVLSDSGFHTEANVKYVYEHDINGYVADNLFRKRDPRFADQSKYKPAPTPTQYRPKDFLFDPDQRSCICPAGKALYRNGNSVWVDGKEGFKFKGTKRECLPCEQRARCLRNPDQTAVRQVVFFKDLKRDAKNTYTAKMKAKIDTEEGRYLYGKRLGIVEPVFGNLANKGLKRFSLRGRTKVDTQWKLMCLVHNIEKIANYGMTMH